MKKRQRQRHTHTHTHTHTHQSIKEKPSTRHIKNFTVLVCGKSHITLIHLNELFVDQST